MVKKINIGVIGIQGAISEHVNIMQKALKINQRAGEVFVVKQPMDIEKLDALIIPGGESTTISRILYRSGLYDIIKFRILENNISIMGTCAGCVLLASKVIGDSKDIKQLNAMNIEVKRNAFGRQKESFEQNINIKSFSKPYNAVFIRAPVIEKVGNNCEVLGKIDKKIVMARQDKFLASSFHPELTGDLRVHKYFLEMI